MVSTDRVTQPLSLPLDSLSVLKKMRSFLLEGQIYKERERHRRKDLASACSLSRWHSASWLASAVTQACLHWLLCTAQKFMHWKLSSSLW